MDEFEMLGIFDPERLEYLPHALDLFRT